VHDPRTTAPPPARLALAAAARYPAISPAQQKRIDEHRRAGELARDLGIHDMAVRIAEASQYSYPTVVDLLACAVTEGRAQELAARYGVSTGTI
jgi:hypothetical protein